MKNLDNHILKRNVWNGCREPTKIELKKIGDSSSDSMKILKIEFMQLS